jgi:phage gp37-like protein
MFDDKGIYSALEDAILAELEPLRDSPGVRTLDSYGGEFSAESIGEAALVFPAVYVHVGMMENTDRNQTAARVYQVYVYAADQNARGESEARRGGTERPGVYALLDEIRSRVNRRPILDGRTVPRLMNEKVIGYSKINSICVAQAVYSVRVSVA